MTETPDRILARAQLPPVNGRPVRKDEIEILDRGLYIESWLRGIGAVWPANANELARSTTPSDAANFFSMRSS